MEIFISIVFVLVVLALLWKVQAAFRLVFHDRQISLIEFTIAIALSSLPVGVVLSQGYYVPAENPIWQIVLVCGGLLTIGILWAFTSRLIAHEIMKRISASHIGVKILCHTVALSVIPLLLLFVVYFDMWRKGR